MSYLEDLVVFKCRELGDALAAKFFDVSEPLIRQWTAGSKRPSLSAVEKVFVVPEAAPVEANWEGKEVYICLPQYKTTNPVTLFSLLGIWDRQKFGALMEYGDAMIVHAREALAEKFLASGKPESLWFDDDMIFPMGNADWYRRQTGIPMPDEFAGLHTANRLLSHEGKTIVGGLYFGRHPHGRAMYYEALVDSPEGAVENARAHEAPFNSLRPTRWAGTGCLRINRQVFLDIRMTHPHLESTFLGEPFHYFTNASDGAMRRFTLIEETLANSAVAAEANRRDEGLKLVRDALQLISEAKSDNLRSAHLMQGEDQTFGIRAGKAGHQSYVDMGLVCGHIGTCVYGPHNTRAPSPRHVHN